MSEIKSNQSVSSHSKRETSQLTEMMTQRLQDQSIVERYGTSLKISMGQEYTEYLNQKYAKLKSEFEMIDKDSNQELSFDELFEFLKGYEKETNIPLTKEYIQDLFDLMDKDHGSTISM